MKPRVIASFCVAIITAVGTLSAQSVVTPAPTHDKPEPLFSFWNEEFFHGYSDAHGRVVIPPRFLTTEDFSEGLARVGVCTEYGPMEGFIDATGRLVIPAKFDWAGNFSEGLAQVVINGKSGFINKNGVMVIQPRFEADILEDFKFSEGLAAIQVGEQWGYINRAGHFVIKPRFEQAAHFSEGMAVVEIDEKSGFIDKTGKVVIKPRFDLAGEFSEGLAKVNIGYTRGLNPTDPKRRDGEWGYIDRTGTIVIEPQFEFADSFYQGRALVRKNGKVGFINKSGQVVIDIKYEGAWEFSEGLAPVKLGGMWGYIDLEGKTVIPFQFRGARSFDEGVAKVNDFKNRINKSGEIIWTQRPSTTYSSAKCVAKIEYPPATPDEISQRRKAVHKLMLKGRYQHDGSGELLYVGDISSVPVLLGVLKTHAPKTYPGAVICTYSHAVAALQRITGHNATRYEDWQLWWEQYQKTRGTNVTK